MLGLLTLLACVAICWTGQLNICSRNADCPVAETECLLASSGMCFCQPPTSNQRLCPFTSETENGKYHDVTNLQSNQNKFSLVGPILALNQSNNASKNIEVPTDDTCKSNEDCKTSNGYCLRLKHGCECRDKGLLNNPYAHCKSDDSKWQWTPYIIIGVFFIMFLLIFIFIIVLLVFISRRFSRARRA